MDNGGLTVLHVSWAYQVLASKTADNRGLTVPHFNEVFIYLSSNQHVYKVLRQSDL